MDPQLPATPHFNAKSPFFGIHYGLRALAFGMDFDQYGSEMSDAGRGASGLRERCQGLAEIGGRSGRSSAPLVSVAQDATADAQQRLATARRLPFPEFLRSALDVFPLLYSLRDIWFEARYLAADEETQLDCESSETLVDELQGDIYQLTLSPDSGRGLLDLEDWHSLSLRERRRRARFWLNSRVQFNNELANELQNASVWDGPADEAHAYVLRLERRCWRRLTPGQQVVPEFTRNLLRGGEP